MINSLIFSLLGLIIFSVFWIKDIFSILYVSIFWLISNGYYIFWILLITKKRKFNQYYYSSLIFSYGIFLGIASLIKYCINVIKNYIAERIDKAKAIIEKDGHPKFADFSQANKEALRDLVVEIDKNTSVRASVTKGSVIVKNEDGTTFAEVTELVKQTGSESTKLALMSSISLIIVLAGTALIGKQAKSIR